MSLAQHTKMEKFAAKLGVNASRSASSVTVVLGWYQGLCEGCASFFKAFLVQPFCLSEPLNHVIMQGCSALGGHVRGAAPQSSHGLRLQRRPCALTSSQWPSPWPVFSASSSCCYVCPARHARCRGVSSISVEHEHATQKRKKHATNKGRRKATHSRLKPTNIACLPPHTFKYKHPVQGAGTKTSIPCLTAL